MVNVTIPNNLSNEQREIFDQLAESLGSEVRPQERGFLDWLKEAISG
jgi:molecular chaperone DnaJ